MKKLLLIISAIVIFPFIVISQPCLPNGILFSTQTEIDSFQINHPNCTEIEGYVGIGVWGSDITNLNGLNVLTVFHRVLKIEGNSLLTSLTGLDNVTSIGGYLMINGNDALTSLTGLDNVTSIGEWLGIGCNSSLTSLTGLDNLTAIGENLMIEFNHSLASLTGLDNIDAGSISNLFINDNMSLSTCEVKSICDYLASPGGTVNIYFNATGCNSPEEVEQACEIVSIQDRYMIEDCRVSPNPFTTSTTIFYTLSEPSPVTIRIFNSQGHFIEKLEQKQPKGEQQIQWNAEGLPAGMYYFRIQAGDKVGGGKMVKM